MMSGDSDLAMARIWIKEGKTKGRVEALKR
jgi:hypothetical protein